MQLSPCQPNKLERKTYFAEIGYFIDGYNVGLLQFSKTRYIMFTKN